MVRRAEWSPTARLPRGDFLARLARAAGWRVRALILFVAVLMLVEGVAGYAGGLTIILVAAGFALVPAPRQILRWMANAPPRAVRPTLDVGPLLTLPPPATPYPCRVEMWDGPQLLGEDFGVVTFLEGWMHFEGYRTNFALAGVNVVRRRGSRLWLVAGGELVFFPDDALFAGNHVELDLRRRFPIDLTRWLVAEAPDGPPRLPPRGVDRSAVVRARQDLAIEALLAGPCALAALALSSARFGPFFLVLPACGLVLAAFRLAETAARFRRDGRRPAVE